MKPKSAPSPKPWHILGIPRAVLFAALLWGQPTLAQDNFAPLPTTITNPTPAAFDVFGGSVASVGNDHVLVGAEGAAEVYLFNLNGTLLSTFTSPDLAAGGGLGASVTAVGSDRVLCGAYNYSAGSPLAQVGRAYLFSTNGTRLMTFTNPAPAVQAFGWSVAAMGSDRVLIGALDGAAYLFRTNGTLLHAFNIPTSAAALAAVGTEWVLVGAPYDDTGAPGAGSAYLFNTNGTLVTTITNPIPAAGDNFGSAVAALGSDLVLISAIDYDGSKGTGGAAYLFRTNGTLLMTFTNPAPAPGASFGWSLAAVGSTRVLIGAYQANAGEFQAGAAYLFGTNGTLLNTFTNPTPARQDWFAWSVASAGSDRVILGGVWDDTGATDAGAAYVYALPYPPLKIARNADKVSVTWISPEPGLILQQTDQLGPAAVWNDTTNTVFTDGLTNAVQPAIPTGITNRFFRLRRP